MGDKDEWGRRGWVREEEGGGEGMVGEEEGYRGRRRKRGWREGYEEGEWHNHG